MRRARIAAMPPDEREVQRHLLALVWNKRKLLPGCFMVDQLVFQESMVKSAAKRKLVLHIVPGEHGQISGQAEVSAPYCSSRMVE